MCYTLMTVTIQYWNALFARMPSVGESVAYPILGLLLLTVACIIVTSWIDSGRNGDGQ